VPFLFATNIDCCSINLGIGHKYISANAHAQRKRANCSPLQGDVLVSKAGRIGTATTNHLRFEYSVFESVALVRVSDASDPDFLAIFLNAEPGMSQIERLQKVAVQKHLHLEELRELRVPQIDPVLQRAIGNNVRKAVRLREL
jgi:type I restriction enzyme, S subunit